MKTNDIKYWIIVVVLCLFLPGSIQAAETKRTLPEALKQYDTDGDGQLSQEEREAAREARKAEKLKKYDTDGDGELSQQEREAAREGGKAKMIEKFDTDGDGKLSEDERKAARESKQRRSGSASGDRKGQKK